MRMAGRKFFKIIFHSTTDFCSCWRNPMLSFGLKFLSRQSACFQHHHHRCRLMLPLTIFFYYLFFVETESNRHLSTLNFFEIFFISHGCEDLFLFRILKQTANGFSLKFDKWFLFFWMENSWRVDRDFWYQTEILGWGYLRLFFGKDFREKISINIFFSASQS